MRAGTAPQAYQCAIYCIEHGRALGISSGDDDHREIKARGRNAQQAETKRKIG